MIRAFTTIRASVIASSGMTMTLTTAGETIMTATIGVLPTTSHGLTMEIEIATTTIRIGTSVRKDRDKDHDHDHDHDRDHDRR